MDESAPSAPPAENGEGSSSAPSAPPDPAQNIIQTFKTGECVVCMEKKVNILSLYIISIWLFVFLYFNQALYWSWAAFNYLGKLSTKQRLLRGVLSYFHSSIYFRLGDCPAGVRNRGKVTGKIRKTPLRSVATKGTIPSLFYYSKVSWSVTFIRIIMFSYLILVK